MPQQSPLTLAQLDLYRRERLALAKLTEKQKVFCEVYVRTFSKELALKEGGYYTPQHKGGAQTKLMEHDFERVFNLPHVQEYINLLKQSVASRLGFSMDDIVDEFKAMAFTNMDDYVSWTHDSMKLKSSSQLTKAQKAGILEIKETSGKTGKVVTIKLHNKQPALERLFDILKELELHESKVEGPAKITQVQINTILMDPIKRRSIEHLAECLYDKQIALVGNDKQRVEFEENMAKITKKMIEVQNGVKSNNGDGAELIEPDNSHEESVRNARRIHIENVRKKKRTKDQEDDRCGGDGEDPGRKGEEAEDIKPEYQCLGQGEEESDAGSEEEGNIETGRYNIDGL